MLTAPALAGTYVALITPMEEAASGGDTLIDWAFFDRLVDDTLNAGVSGIVFAGTTGQSATLDDDELVELCVRGAERVRAWNARGGRNAAVIFGAGSNSTRKAIAASRELIAAGRPDALLHVSGYYNNPPQEGLLRHFEAVADACGAMGTPVILYNVPGRTKSNIEAGTTIALAAHPAIIGIKEASGDLAQVARILAETDRTRFTVVSGEDDQVAAIMRLGGTGVISASANRWPREFSALTSLALAGRHAEAEELQSALLPCVRATFCVKNPIPLHAMFGTAVRLPMVGLESLDDATRLKAVATIDAALRIAYFPHVDVRQAA